MKQGVRKCSISGSNSKEERTVVARVEAGHVSTDESVTTVVESRIRLEGEAIE